MTPTEPIDLQDTDPHLWSMDAVDEAHIAGLIDAVGTITVKIRKSDEYKLGYTVEPRITFTRQKSEEALLGKLDAYCADHGVQYNLHEEQNRGRYIFLVVHRASIDRFLRPLLPYLVTQHYEATLMVEEILPRLERNEHLTKFGFIEMMGLVDELREGMARSNTAKYDQDYFIEQWAEEAPA